MKTVKHLMLLVVGLSSVAFFSCRKNHSGTTSSSLPKYEKRWNILDSLSHRPAISISTNKGTFLHTGTKLAHRPEQDSLPNYSAIEFLINSYVIFFQDGTVQVGQYTATNDTTLVLDSVGTVKITSITTATFSFILIPIDGTPPISITATAANPIGNFTSTSDIAFISNTWKLDSTTFYLPVPDSSDWDLNDTTISATYALFSQYGTYLVRNVYTDGHEDYETNTWIWTTTDHSGICYGNWDGQNFSNCDSLRSLKFINYVAPYTKLIMDEADSTDPLRYYLSKQ